MYTNNQKKFRKENLKLWNEKLLSFFNGSIPDHCEWKDIKQIKDIITIFGVENLNHMIYPDGGGFDIVGANISKLRSSIFEILTQGEMPNICKPRELVFDSIDSEPEWSYFRLELCRLEPAGFYLNKDVVVEQLYERNGFFEPYSDYPPNKEWRLILRILGGSLLIIPKMCYYNFISDTYLGIHNNYDCRLFKDFMQKLKLSEGYINFLNSMT